VKKKRGALGQKKSNRRAAVDYSAEEKRKLGNFLKKRYSEKKTGDDPSVERMGRKTRRGNRGVQAYAVQKKRKKKKK